MTSALIGHSGFVGTTLKKQRSFEALYRSTNIEEIQGKYFDLVICAGAPAQKWLANKDPEGDRAALQRLMHNLEKVEAKQFVLISTVDVFATPVCVDESTPVEEEGLHAYGQHRRQLEKFVAQRFDSSLIVRLPGLVGPGLRKNVIYDFLNDNNLQAIESRGVFQFYPMVNLWADIQIALQAGIPLVHLSAEPISVQQVAEQGFGKAFTQELPGTPARYDMRSQYASLYGKQGDYTYSGAETLLAIRAYAQSEPRAGAGAAVEHIASTPVTGGKPGK